MPQVLSIDWLYGCCELVIETNCELVEIKQSHSVADVVELPDGYRIDDCMLAFATYNVDPGDLVKISRSWKPVDYVSTSQDTAQYMDTFIVETDSEERFGHFGSADPEWFELQNFKLMDSEFSGPEFTLTIRANSNGTIPIGIAASWTNQPGPMGGMLDSFFGVDRAILDLKKF